VDRTERGFTANAEQVRAARSFTHGVMDNWGLESSDVVLVVGELAANAVRHAKSEFTLSLRRLDDSVTVEVTDTSPEQALLATPAPSGTSGRGLIIVDRLALVWGSRPAGCGKTVWAEIRAH
jgi:anti-sigma regulatory factor (Ser/Thr protein kinase)